MIPFPAIWWLFPAAALAFISFSFLLTRSGKLESETVRKTLVGAGAMLGFLGLALPLFAQPTFRSPLVQYGFGLPLLILGLFGRVYPAIYLRRKGTTTTLDEVGKLVDSGPYAWVRHPQYTAGLIMLLGWFLAWGAWYALASIPIIAGMIYAQALIEEKYILEKLFGKAYAAYRERVGMLLPRLPGKRSLRITTAFLGVYAGLIAVQHGIFATLQGSRAPDGLMFSAIGPPCQPEAVWHACFPAMTVIPNLLVTGIAAVLVGLAMAVWAAAFVPGAGAAGLSSGRCPCWRCWSAAGLCRSLLGCGGGNGQPPGCAGQGRRDGLACCVSAVALAAGADGALAAGQLAAGIFLRRGHAFGERIAVSRFRYWPAGAGGSIRFWAC
jgi:protein-S-isoprenylcysteine O-methyltransferase Ste14